jgi:hypothetical protein
MTRHRNLHVAVPAVAVVLIGMTSLTPSFARSHHGHAHLQAHHSSHVSGTAVPTLSADHPDQGHPVGGDKADIQPAAKASHAPANPAGNAASNKQPVTIGRGGKQDGDGGHPQDDHVKETTGGALANNGRVTDFHMKDLGPVDTRITVVPQDHAGPGYTHHPEAKKFRLVGPQHRHAEEKPAVKKFERNAIGLPVTVRIARSTEDGEQAALPSATKNPGVPGATVRTYQNIDRPGFHPSAGPATPAVVVARQAMSGTGLVRRGFVPAAIGGPAKPVGINGSMFRPKR